jgi:hypothetical protein
MVELLRILVYSVKNTRGLTITYFGKVKHQFSSANQFTSKLVLATQNQFDEIGANDWIKYTKFENL